MLGPGSAREQQEWRPEGKEEHTTLGGRELPDVVVTQAGFAGCERRRGQAEIRSLRVLLGFDLVNQWLLEPSPQTCILASLVRNANTWAGPRLSVTDILGGGGYLFLSSRVLLGGGENYPGSSSSYKVFERCSKNSLEGGLVWGTGGPSGPSAFVDVL